MRKALVIGLMLAFASASQAAVIFSEDFESYDWGDALAPTWTQIYPAAPAEIDDYKGYNSNQSSIFTVHANYTERAYVNFGQKYYATDAMPVKLEFMVDLDVANWYTREYIELRAYENGAYGDGALQNLLALGFTSSGVDTTLLNRRTITAGWGNYDGVLHPAATRAAIAAADWTKVAMVVKTTTVDFYINDQLNHTASRGTAEEGFDCIVLGSGLSNNTAVWFDDVVVSQVPEPATLALLGLGGLFLRRRR